MLMKLWIPLTHNFTYVFIKCFPYNVLCTYIYTWIHIIIYTYRFFSVLLIMLSWLAVFPVRPFNIPVFEKLIYFHFVFLWVKFAITYLHSKVKSTVILNSDVFEFYLYLETIGILKELIFEQMLILPFIYL